MTALSQMTERQSVPSALLSDINLNLVREHIDTAIKRREYDGPTEPEEYLIEHGCLLRDDDGAFSPTLAGMALQALAPQMPLAAAGDLES